MTLSLRRFARRHARSASLALCLAAASRGEAADYFLDALAGSDGSDGRSAASAWASLKRASEFDYAPGDRLLLRAGQSFRGSLLLKGSGTKENPIVLGSFGEGPRPRIEGDGRSNFSRAGVKAISCAVCLFNQEHWRILNLEITNYNPDEENGLSLERWEGRNIEQYVKVVNPKQDEGGKVLKVGILVQAKGVNATGALAGLHFKNLEIHGINGDMATKDNGGIFFQVYDDGSGKRMRFDDVRFEDNLIRDVDRTGISNVSSFDQRTFGESASWTPNRGWVFLRNTFLRTGANALIVRVADKPLMQDNLFDHCAIKGSGNAAFSFNTDGAIWRSNEFRFTKANDGDEDAGGVDSDYRSKGTLIELNYSHDNDFGMLVTGGPGRFNDGTVVRNNLIVNDGLRERKGGEGRFAIRVSGSATNTLFYRNTIILGEGLPETKVVFHKRWDTWSARTEYRENTIINRSAAATIQVGESQANRFVDNRYFGSPVQEPAAKREIYLLIGQSNMAGRAPIEAQDEAPVESFDLFTDAGAWEMALNPLNRYSSIRKDLAMQKLGPGYAFAKRLRELRPDVPVGLVVNARGGTRIEEWAKGGPIFAEAVRRAREASASGHLAGILWHQGEGNSKDERYLEKLVQLVRDLRQEFGDPTLPFVAGMVEGERLVNRQIAQLAGALPYCGVASSGGLGTIDGTHFDSASVRALGIRYADALVALRPAPR